MRARWWLAAVVMVAGCRGEPARMGPTGGSLAMLAFADVNGDGRIDIIGRDGHAEHGQTRITAFDGDTLARRWTRAVDAWAHTEVVGGHLVFTKQLARDVEIADLATGVTRHRVPLSDRVAYVVADGAALRIGAIDGVQLRFDPATGARSEADGPRPATGRTCPEVSTPCRALAGRDLELRDATGGDLVIQLVRKPVGTPELSVVGPGWRAVVEPNGYPLHGAALADGVLYLALPGQLRAIDAATGAAVFTLRGGPRAIEVVGDRLYVETEGPRTSKATEVIDRTTGGVRFRFGRPRWPLEP